MADRRNKRESKSSKNEKFTDKYAKKLLNFLDNSTEEVDQIGLMNDTFRSVVNTHLKDLKSASSGAIIDFIQFNEKDTKKNRHNVTCRNDDFRRGVYHCCGCIGYTRKCYR